MSSSAGVLDFFIIEANEYIERLDGLLASAGAHGPDTAAFARNARMLRGSATMSRRQGIAAVAGALERVARALASSELHWDPALAAAVTGTVDDLRILLRNARVWSISDDQRSAARVAELERFSPPSATPGSAPPSSASQSGNTFLSRETADISLALDRFDALPSVDLLAKALDRLRALRGVADVRDMAPLGEVMEGVEDTLKALELGSMDAVTDAQRALTRAASAVLRRASHELAGRGLPTAESSELEAFRAAMAALPQHAGKGDRIVPITQLFHDDSGPHVISTSAHPPTTSAERFRLEVVSLAEHLRVVVSEARAAGSGPQRERAGREIRNALRALGSAAHSFGERTVARFAAEWSTRASALNEQDLVALDKAGAMLADPSTSAFDIERGLNGSSAPGKDTPARQHSPIRTPTGQDLHRFLQDGIAGFRQLEERPLSPPATIPDDDVVPIEQLLYRGRGALERASSLRNELLGEQAVPPREAVQELFDLIELALAE